MNLSERRKKSVDDIIWDLSWAVVQVDDVTAGIGTHHTEGVATELDPGRQDALTFKMSLESDTDSTILQELDGRQSTLVLGLQELSQDVGRSNKIIDSRLKERH